MRPSVLAGVFAFAGSSAAFSDSSPWILSSTEPLPSGLNDKNIQTSDNVLKATKALLSKCPTDSYAIVVQPGLHWADLTTERDPSGELRLMTVPDNSKHGGKFVVPEVVGQVVDGLELKDFIAEACQKKNKEVEVAHIELRALPENVGDARATVLKSNDEEAANSALSKLKKDSYTFIFFGTPASASEATIYEPEFEETVIMDLRRNVQGQPSTRRSSNETEWNKLPLFEKYQFFTPGIFMGLLAVILLGSILTVGIKALYSLEVSYGAFEKDMGPAAQKKQQ